MDRVHGIYHQGGQLRHHALQSGSTGRSRRRTSQSAAMASQLEFITAFATVVGCMEAIRQVQQKSRRQEHRSRKNNLLVHCAKSSRHTPIIEGRHVVLSGDKVCVLCTTWSRPWAHFNSCTSTQGQSGIYLSGTKSVATFKAILELNLKGLYPQFVMTLLSCE